MPLHRPILGISLAGAVLAAACNAPRPAAGNGTLGATPTSTPPATAAPGASSSSSGAAGSSGTGGGSSGGSSSGGSPQGDASVDAGVADAMPIDAAPRPVVHIDDVCNISPIAWWATAPAVDPALSSPAFAEALNGLFALPNAHPFTLAAFTDNGAWRFVATASLANGIGQQYFPFDHAATSVSSPAPGLTIGTPGDVTLGTAWLHVVDAASHDVWIALEHVAAHATIDDDYCTRASGGVLTATVAPAAGAATLSPVGGSSITLATLLGPESGAGWPLRVTFDAEKVQITLK